MTDVDKTQLQIRELRPEDAETLIAYTKQIGGESDNLIADGSLNSLPRRMSHRAELGMTVTKANWNQGVGSMLMERLIQYAKDNGIELIYLEVREDNAAAIHLYEKFGFRQTGTLPAYFKIGDAYIDFISMCLDLRKRT